MGVAQGGLGLRRNILVCAAWAGPGPILSKGFPAIWAPSVPKSNIFRCNLAPPVSPHVQAYEVDAMLHIHR